MSIIVNGVDMPNTCAVCAFLATDSYAPPMVYWCAAMREKVCIDDPSSGRDYRCPLEAIVGERADASSALKPCPFCGGQARVDIYQEQGFPPWYAVSCGRCGATTRVKPTTSTEEQAVAEWNRRTAINDPNALNALGVE